jgi:hypothetical protein
LTRITPPLLGYNNNVRYLGRTFHIQTEDSGTKYARIMTHLFIDGGHIVKSTRTEYGAVLDQSDMAETVRRMMKDQHKNMFLALRAGEFDELIERVVSGGQTTPPIEPALSHVPRLRADSLPSLSFGVGDEAKTMPGLVIDLTPTSASPEKLRSELAHAAQPREDLANPGSVHADLLRADPVPEDPGKVSTTQPAAPATKRPSARPRKGKSSVPPSPRRARLVDDPTPTDLPQTKPLLATSRPSERPSRTVGVRPPTSPQEVTDPRNQSIFGESAAGRQTLDEVILSFLEDEDT